MAFPSRQRSDLCCGWLDVEILGAIIGTMADDPALAAPVGDLQPINPYLPCYLFHGQHTLFSQPFTPALEAGILTDLPQDAHIEHVAVAGAKSASIENVDNLLIVVLAQ